VRTFERKEQKNKSGTNRQVSHDWHRRKSATFLSRGKQKPKGGLDDSSFQGIAGVVEQLPPEVRKLFVEQFYHVKMIEKDHCPFSGFLESL
jgi:hypothetical protein